MKLISWICCYLMISYLITAPLYLWKPHRDGETFKDVDLADDVSNEDAAFS